MDVEIKLDKSCAQPHIIILTDKITDEITELVQRLSDDSPKVITGCIDDKLVILNPDDIVRIFACDGKVTAVTDSKEYTLKIRLYEAEERLSKNSFVRISKSEIINIRKIKCFDLSITGTVCVTMKNGNTAYVSRRYVSKIKKILGV